MKVRHHIAASLIVSGALFLIFKSVPMALAALVSGIFIDLDHVLEYLCGPEIKLDIEHFFMIFEEGLLIRSFLFLHSWELMAILFVACWSSGWDLLLTGIFIGMVQHLALDQIFNLAGPCSYFFIWRLKNKFVFRTCFPKAVKTKD